MSEKIAKAAAKAKEIQDSVSAAVASARTRKGEPKVTKPPPKEATAEQPPAPVDMGARVDAFITHQKSLLGAIELPDDTGDAMYNAITEVLYYQERISKAQLVKKYLAEG